MRTVRIFWLNLGDRECPVMRLFTHSSTKRCITSHFWDSIDPSLCPAGLAIPCAALSHLLRTTASLCILRCVGAYLKVARGPANVSGFESAHVWCITNKKCFIIPNREPTCLSLSTQSTEYVHCAHNTRNNSVIAYIWPKIYYCHNASAAALKHRGTWAVCWWALVYDLVQIY